MQSSLGLVQLLFSMHVFSLNERTWAALEAQGHLFVCQASYHQLSEIFNVMNWAGSQNVWITDTIVCSSYVCVMCKLTN